MKLRIMFSLLFIVFGLSVHSEILFQKFDKSAFYAVIKAGKMNAINNELSELQSASGKEKEAYEGTLLMRKAGLVTIPAQKLKLFKSGRIKLETVLAKDSTNAEYRFLRLIIQENAPNVVKYRSNLLTDKAYIQKSFKTLSPVIQQAIIDYSKNSKVLQPQDF